MDPTEHASLSTPVATPLAAHEPTGMQVSICCGLGRRIMQKEREFKRENTNTTEITHQGRCVSEERVPVHASNYRYRYAIHASECRNEADELLTGLSNVLIIVVVRCVVFDSSRDGTAHHRAHGRPPVRHHPTRQTTVSLRNTVHE